MPNYIEFTTQHAEITYGNPIHDGRAPKRFRDVDAIRVDGNAVSFLDESIPERMHRYFIESRKLRRRRIANDCVAFVALMQSIELTDRAHNPFRDYDRGAEVDPLSDTPIVLAQGFHDGAVVPRHVVLPAPTGDGSFGSVHKLGDKGPLCLSSVEDAMTIVGCTHAFPASRCR